MHIDESDTVTREIKLPSGETLHVQLTSVLADKIREHFGVHPGAHLDDDHIRMYIYGSVKNAIDQAVTS